MFCSTIRQRPYLREIFSVFVSQTPKLREAQLKAHDVSLPLANRPRTNAGPTSDTGQVRFLVLVSHDIESSAEAMVNRIARLASLTGGTNVALAFVDEPSAAFGFETLQLLLFNNTSLTYLPILPIATPETLLPTLLEYVETISKPLTQVPRNPQPHASSLALLQHTTPSGPAFPILEHELLMLTDLVGSFKELVELESSEVGRRWLEEKVGKEVEERLRAFWSEEYALD